MPMISSGFGVARQEVTQRYWKASRAWHGFDSEGWTVESLLEVLAGLRCMLSDRIAFHASIMLEEVINDRPNKRKEPAQVFQFPVLQELKLLA